MNKLQKLFVGWGVLLGGGGIVLGLLPLLLGKFVRWFHGILSYEWQERIFFMIWSPHSLRGYSTYELGAGLLVGILLTIVVVLVIFMISYAFMFSGEETETN